MWPEVAVGYLVQNDHVYSILQQGYVLSAWGELIPLLPLDEDEKRIVPSTPSVERK